ncbi:transposable element Tcb1 transposase [Trichonephila clavipes]|nr:transposable element Tcb1 transposase [Trichonephila clavipes]
MDQASICETMMTTFVLDAMPVNAAFQDALSKNIVALHQKLWFGVRSRNMEDPICYNLSVISIATGTCVKCYSPKSFLSFEASLELSFSRIIQAHMLQRLFKTSVQPNTSNFFLSLLIGKICIRMDTKGYLFVLIQVVCALNSIQLG